MQQPETWGPLVVAVKANLRGFYVGFPKKYLNQSQRYVFLIFYYVESLTKLAGLIQSEFHIM
jgi:hypothetical protein